MRTQEIEGNKLIAEFMGFPKIEIGTLWDYNRGLDQANNTVGLKISEITPAFGGEEGVRFEQSMPYKSYGVSYFDGRIFKPHGWDGRYNSPDKPYHSSWDWLMPVVEKIGNAHYYRFEISKNQCWFWNEEESVVEISNIERDNLLEAVWLAVVEFIKWYNNQQKP